MQLVPQREHLETAVTFLARRALGQVRVTANNDAVAKGDTVRSLERTQSGAEMGT